MLGFQPKLIVIEGKAIQRRNSYQKVINCPSEPRRLIFVYGDAIFALPEAFFFGYSGAIFERSRSLFSLTAVTQNTLALHH